MYLWERWEKTLANRVVITKEIIRNRPYLVTALFEGQRLTEVSCSAVGSKSMLGSIFIGKIKRIAKNVGAAFVELWPGEMAYLPLSEVKEPLMVKQARAGKLTEEDELVVQVVKEAIKTKEPTLSTYITLTGQNLVFTTENQLLGISKKLNNQDREYFKELFAEKKEDWYGLIVRTSAKNNSKEQIFREFDALYAQFCAITKQYLYRTCYSCLYRAPSAYISSVQNYLSLDLERVVTDDADVYEELKEVFGEGASQKEEQIVFYEDKLLYLSALYGLKGKLEDALKERVWLKSGGYLVIQPTEALTVIDVNSGKSVKGVKKGLNIKINLEAAEEIARQLRLRNISGICIVDFINMDTKEEKEELVRSLKSHLAKDSVQTVFVDFTKLGLVEITRKKVKKPLWEQCRGV